MKLVSSIGLLMLGLLLPACGGGAISADGWVLEELQLLTSDGTIHVSSVAQLSVLGRDNNCDIYDYTDRAAFSSSNPAVATVNASGVVTGVTAGTATMTASFKGFSDTVQITVLAGVLTSIRIEVAPSEGLPGGQGGLPVGATAQATAIGVYDDLVEDDLTSVATWSSNDEAVATVDAAGLVTGVAAGPATIMASFQAVDGTLSGDVIAVNLIAILVDGDDEVAINASLPLAAIGIYNDGSTRDVTDEISWSSSDTTVATVDAMGVVTPVAIGTVVISATDGTNGNVSGDHNLAVVSGILESLEIYLGDSTAVAPITELDIVISTETLITVWGRYSDGSLRNVNPDAFWWSSDQDTASINWQVSSRVTGRDLGTAVITAYFGGTETTLDVTVIPEDGRLLESIDIVMGGSADPADTITDVTVPLGDYVYITAYGNFSDGTRVYINQEVSWSTGDSTIAYNNDFFSSNLYGISDGMTTVSASWQGVTQTIPVEVVDSTPQLESIEIQINYSGGGDGEIIDENNPLFIGVGDVQHITAWGNYSDGIKRYINTDVLWVSADNGIAKMDPLQRSSDVTGVSPGTTEVVCVLDGIAGRAPVTVTDSGVPFLVSIDVIAQIEGPDVPVDDNNPLLLNVDQSIYVAAYGTYSNGDRVYINTDVFWFSSNNTIAAMDLFQRGSYVEGRVPGSTRINCTLDGVTFSAPVIVSALD